MELSVRDWMIIVGVLLIVVVVVDGLRRVRNERRGNIRMSLNKQFLNSEGAEEVDDYSSELPSGGARVIGRKGSELDFEQSVPMLMESVHTANDADDYETTERDFESTGGGERPNDQHSATGTTKSDEVEPEDDIADVLMAEPGSAHETEPSAINVSPSTQQEVLVINVKAKQGHFKGADLLHILLACDCRFGEMNIFHRYEDASAKGAVQFSIVNMVEPGVFDLDSIEGFSTPGVSFFMAFPGPKDAMKAFDCMVETAQCLVKNLDGELLDESRSVMTGQTLEHCRQKIRDFERRQLAYAE